MTMLPHKLTGAALPPGVSDLERPPRQLFLWGQLPPLPWVAIVGTRRPSSEAAEYTKSLATDLARQGCTVVSGGALGIDAAAHRGALSAGAATLVVAPSSFDRPYPAEHATLFEQAVGSGGGVLSEHESGAVARRHVFFSRNALMVACCAAVVLVEAPHHSGARNAAMWACRLGRPLLVVPHSPWHSRGRGGLLELQLGARPICGARDVVAALHAVGARPTTQHAQLELAGFDAGPADTEAALPPADNADIARLLSDGPCSFQDLASASGWSVSRLQGVLFEMVLGGHVELTEAGYRLR